MKSAESGIRGWRSLVCVGLLVVALASLAHFKGAMDGREAAAPQIGRGATLATNADRHPAVRGGTPSAKQSEGAGRAAAKRLVWQWGNSPAPQFDYELQAATTRLLEKMSSAEIAILLEGIPKEYGMIGSCYQLRRQIMEYWMLADGPAALEFTAKTERGVGLDFATRGFIGWSTEDPDAALAWLARPDHSPEQQKLLGGLRLNAMIWLADSDPDRAFAELAGVGTKAATEILQAWAECYGQKEGMRQRLLDQAFETGGEQMRERMRASIVTTWATSDPAAAIEYIRSLGLPDSELALLDGMVALGQARGNPKAALDGWLERNPSVSVVPQPIHEAVSMSLLHNAYEGMAWMKGLPAGDAKDAIYADAARSMTASKRFAYAAEITDTIETLEVRVKELGELNHRWSRSDPEKAAAWRAGLSEDDRAILSAGDPP